MEHTKAQLWEFIVEMSELFDEPIQVSKRQRKQFLVEEFNRLTLISEGEEETRMIELPQPLRDVDARSVQWSLVLEELKERVRVKGYSAQFNVDVIPYKAYQALASNKILISRGGPAISALLVDESPRGLVLVPPADPAALAEAIVQVVDSYTEIFSQFGGRALYDQYLSNEKVFAQVAQRVAQL